MAGRGGKRPGAGRKPGAVKRERVVTQTPVQLAELKLTTRLPELVDKALELALAGEGNERLLIYCIDRVLGKPTQPIDLMDAVRKIAIERGLEPERVINLYEVIRKRGAAS